MESLIRQMPTWQTATNAEIRAFFQEATSTPITTKYTYGDAIDRLTANLIAEGVAASDASTRAVAMAKRLATSLKANSTADVEADVLFRQFATSPGIALHTIERQSMLATFATAASWPNGTLSHLQALGVRLSTRWADAQGPVPQPLPTNAEIGATVTAMKSADAKTAVRKWVDEQYVPAMHTAINAGKTIAQIEGKTIAQLIA